MLNEIRIDGFKSLEGFSLSIRPGLNVFVGPNGSGKSNVLSLFEFLSHLVNYPLPEAVSRSGGAGTIFRRLPGERIENSIRISLSGYGKMKGGGFSFRYSALRRRTSQYFVEYNWSATVAINENGTNLRFSEQSVSFSVFLDPKRRSFRDRKTGNRKWHFHVETKENTDKKTIRLENIKQNRSAWRNVFNTWPPTIADYLFYSELDYLRYPIIRSLGRFYSPLDKIREDILSGYIYNLNPSRIKESEDIARTAEISEDGSGLAATLYKIQERGKELNYGPFLYVHDEDSSLIEFEALQEYFSLVNSNIVEVSVQNDALENKLVPIARVKGDDDDIKIPLAMLSDGTVKWFALVTAVLSKRAIFSIEEPENFLHPKMQREIIDIIRSNTGSDTEFFFLITTHSETLINTLKPEEVVICQMREGRTLVNRDIPSDLITEEINKTGFGLGYLYVNDMI
ncbi:MAG: AAA family ATPase [Roseitalea porphyridii]|uniref:AAA family ATPase n=1 Tax=Roseitalea porphyridii TaxID=1852022 RepID=UPI0032D8F1DF